MSEKVKAVWGNAQHPERVKAWLKSQGAGDYLTTESCTKEDCLYFVHPNGDEDFIGRSFAFLFEVVDLPLWRAAEEGTYFYINALMEIASENDNRTTYDDTLYESGNYFQSESEAREVRDKIKKLLQNA